jgi:hypothetical protein
MWRSVSHLRAVRTTRDIEGVMTVTAAPLTAPRRHHSALTIGIAVVAFAGVPAIWLPFGRDVTPASALFEGGFLLRLWPLAWPYLLAIPIAAALVRWIASGRLSNAERWAGRLLAAGAACVTGSIWVESSSDGSGPWRAADWTAFLVPLAMLAVGAASGLWALRSGRAPGGLDAIVMMELAYLPNVVLCVLVATSWGALQIGAYAVLLTSAAYGVHVLAVLSGRMAPPSQ